MTGFARAIAAQINVQVVVRINTRSMHSYMTDYNDPFAFGVFFLTAAPPVISNPKLRRIILGGTTLICA